MYQLLYPTHGNSISNLQIGDQVCLSAELSDDANAFMTEALACLQVMLVGLTFSISSGRFEWRKNECDGYEQGKLIRWSQTTRDNSLR